MDSIKLNKRQQNILEAYNRSDLYYLGECYGRCSWAKQRAYDYCRRLCDDMHGWGFTIISYNTCMFSIGFKYVKDGIVWLHYETSRSTLDFKIDVA